jgi:hypothetical protein
MEFMGDNLATRRTFRILNIVDDYEEMSHAIGDPVRLDANFVLMIERLFGEVEAERVEETLNLRRKERARSR